MLHTRVHGDFCYLYELHLETLVHREAAGLNGPGKDSVGRNVEEGPAKVVWSVSKTKVDGAAVASRSKPPEWNLNTLILVIILEYIRTR